MVVHDRVRADEPRVLRGPDGAPHPEIGGEHAPWYVPFGLGVYLLLCGAAAIYLLLDLWTLRFSVLRLLAEGYEIADAQVLGVKTGAYTVVGSIIGAVLRSLQGLHQHGAVHRTFQTSYAGSYLLGPWAAALLGLAAYALVRGGLFVFGGLGQVEEPTEATYLAYLGLGVLTGYAWNKVLVKVGDIAEQLFGSSKPPAPPQPGGPRDEPEASGRAPGAVPRR
jgi:hypothetical protein